MSLHNKFHRKARQREAADLIMQNLGVGTPPSRNDLAFAMSRANESAPEPQTIKWQSHNDTNQLKVVYRGGSPTWRLLKGNEDEPEVVWTVMTDDPEQIYRLLMKREAASQSAEPAEKDRFRDSALPTIGTLFLDRYRILEPIARGGMGQIFLASDVQMNRNVALKVLLMHLLEDEQSKQRFEREMQALTNLKHPNIVSVFDYGYTPDEMPYMIMEYLAGCTLDQHLQEEGCLSVSDFIYVFIQICGALRQAHEKQIIHRDLKPSNIMLIKQSDHAYLAKLVDFGIAKTMGHHSGITKTGEIIGTLYYMSPEQCMNEAMDLRSDVYALGCVMYETLAGSRLFQGDTPLATMMMHMYENPAPFATKNVHVPERLEQIVFKTLAKAPEDRYQSVDELLDELKEFSRQLIEEEPSPRAPSPSSGSTGSDSLSSMLSNNLDVPLTPVLEILVAAELVPVEDAQAVAVFKQIHGGDEGRYLIELGCIDDQTYGSAVQCCSIKERYNLSFEHSILVLRYCSGKGMTVEEALTALN